MKPSEADILNLTTTISWLNAGSINLPEAVAVIGLLIRRYQQLAAHRDFITFCIDNDKSLSDKSGAVYVWLDAIDNKPKASPSSYTTTVKPSVPKPCPHCGR